MRRPARLLTDEQDRLGRAWQQGRYLALLLMATPHRLLPVYQGVSSVLPNHQSESDDKRSTPSPLVFQKFIYSPSIQVFWTTHAPGFPDCRPCSLQSYSPGCQTHSRGSLHAITILGITRMSGQHRARPLARSASQSTSPSCCTREIMADKKKKTLTWPSFREPLPGSSLVPPRGTPRRTTVTSECNVWRLPTPHHQRADGVAQGLEGGKG